MGQNKTNPCRVPRTQADVERAEGAGRLDGMEFMANLTLYILLDKHGAPIEDVREFNGELRGLVESIGEGYVSYADIRRALREEYGIEVDFNL